MFVGMGEDGNINPSCMIQGPKYTSTSVISIGTMAQCSGNVCLIFIQVRAFCFNIIQTRKIMRAEVLGL